MDLENELKQAMAEHVTEVAASRTLAATAKRRHQRTVRRRTAIGTAAAGIVVAVAIMPTYHAINPQTVGASGPEGRRHGQGSNVSTQPTPQGARTPAPTALNPLVSHEPGPPPRHPSKHGHAGLPTSLLGYLPPGINPAKSCHNEHASGKATTVCRWTGPAGWIEVRLMRDGGLTTPDDMGITVPMPKHLLINGHKALRGDGPAVPSQVMWIEQTGLGVWVEVSPGLQDRIVPIAEGVHVS